MHLVFISFLTLLIFGSANQVSPYLGRALLHADRLVVCNYQSSSGTFSGELLWQSGNTLETLSSLMIATKTNKWMDLLENTYQKTPAIIDNCFDDHQWWLLGWVRAYQATHKLPYLQRAAEVFDFVAKNAWTSLCNGGVLWCPTFNPKSNFTNGGAYKNAITNELFFTSAMALHPYTATLGRPQNFYLNWAIREWNWFESTGMINNQGLVNDGLNDQCKNNGQTTWTYNQGVLLSGLSMLYSATNDSKYLQVASKIVEAVFTHLTVNNILVEPCTSCDADQQLFKGIFVRHLGYAASSLSSLVPTLNQFFLNNTNSLIAKAYCQSGSYGLNWEGPCKVQTTTTETSALDLLTSSGVSSTNQPSDWLPIGLGNCADNNNQPMPNCYRSGVSEDECRSAAQRDSKAVAYDLQTDCSGKTFCRVRTLGGSASCLSGWPWEGGAATTVTTSTGQDLSFCVTKK